MNMKYFNYFIITFVLLALFVPISYSDYTDGAAFVSDFEFDEDGNVVKETRHYSDGYIKYEYDEDGNLVKLTRTFPNENTTSSLNYYEYENGTLVKQTLIYSSNYVTSNYVNVLENDGNYKFIKTFNLNHGIITEYEYKYDEDGNVVKESRNYFVNDIVYGYDENGNLIKTVKTYSNGNIITDEYDEDGNTIEWTLKEN